MATATLDGLVRYVRRMGGEVRALADGELLERFAQSRDEPAYAELVRRYGPMVLGVCRRVLRHEHDAEDAFQAAFLVLVRKAGSIRHGESLAGWLFQVAHRLALRARIDQQRRRERLTALSDDLCAGAVDEALRLWLDEELALLPEPYRTAVVLCYVQGRSQAEAARLLATTAEAVNSRLKRARQTLRERLTRRGLGVSAGALVASLTTAAEAVPPALARFAADAALQFAVNPTSCGASAMALALARGGTMSSPVNKLLCVILFLVAIAATAGFALAPSALGDDPPKVRAVQADQLKEKAKESLAGDAKPAKRRHCIILWMSGGPSQLDTFDLKPGNANGGPFKPINTATKDVQISEHLPRLAKLTNHLAIIRSLTHREGDHARGSHLMRTGYAVDGQTQHPPLGAVLAKELPEPKDVPRYVSIRAFRQIAPTAHGSGFLPAKYGPLEVSEMTFRPGDPKGDPLLPPVEAFKDIGGDQAAKMRDAVAKAFDLKDEKPAVHKAYGANAFGKSCLLARRLIERGVPVVEINMFGWDTHADNFRMVQNLSGMLDDGWASLMQDLHVRELLDDTLIVWMGEFGRTPRINAQDGRDHWPLSFSVVLGGGRIKGGQVIGRTNADGTSIEANPVTPAELYATIFHALRIDPTRENRSNTGANVPLVEKGTKPLRAALR
jgi:RNA polymerase sigma factor (sigma-70 family)